MSDLVGNPEDRFSQNEAHIVLAVLTGLYRDMAMAKVINILTFVRAKVGEVANAPVTCNHLPNWPEA